MVTATPAQNLSLTCGEWQQIFLASQRLAVTILKALSIQSEVSSAISSA
jgi:hypothetical protein